MMNILLLSGLWPTKDHNGLIDLANEIDAIVPDYVNIDVKNYDDNGLEPADIMLGHSLGGMKCVELAKKSNRVIYLWLIDPVANWIPFFWTPWINFIIPSSVLNAECFRRRNPIMPPSSRILNQSTTYLNFDITSNHQDAPRHPFVKSLILKHIKEMDIK